MFLEKAEAFDKSSAPVQEFRDQIAIIEAQQAEKLQQQEAVNKQALQAANLCLTRNNYQCALAHADEILTRDPGNGDAIALKQRAELAEQQNREVTQKVQKLLAEADTCMLKKNYACAIAKAETALDLSPNNPQALAKKRKAMETQQKLKESGFNIR